jgi:hypothetical protein
MKKLVMILVLAFMMAINCLAKSDIRNYEYDIVGVKIAKEDYYMVEVSAMIDKKKDATIDVVKKCAIHGCLFKGFSVENISQQPIVGSSHEQESNKEYFEKLINEKYNYYATSSQPILIAKVGKRYRVSSVVVVFKELLRRDLEESGIIRKLGM